MKSKTKPFGEVLVKTIKGHPIHAKTHNQHELVRSVNENMITILAGPAGTGKTFLSTVLATKHLKEEVVDKIVVTRPAVLSGEDLGYLPGELSEKMNPFLKPIYEVLEMIQKKTPEPPGGKRKGHEPEDRVQYNNRIDLVPFAFMRGRNFHNSFILADEMQNSSKEQMKLLMTRIGMGSKMIIDGDINQSDIGYDNGLRYIIERLEEEPVDGIGVVRFDHRDILRNPLINSIEKLF